ncbi:Regucalcin [Eufriesea mexicana]|uniref:Regucalcin n=1 Tax=Eufriesea mexicana TaxID=516756 RepID=A0A310SQM9_9HYME|nr:Regucalcin [Eufriesea mexicana]
MQNIICEVLFLVLCIGFFVHGREIGTKHQDIDELVIEPIVGRFDHSEGPHWDYHTQKLYFVDIEAQKICRFDLATKNLSCIFIAGSGTDFIRVTWDGHKNFTKSAPETLAIVDTNRNNTRWNDGKVDSSGRFWGGTIGPEVNDVVVPNQASLYRIDSHFKPKKELSPVTNSNGLAWNIQDDTFYYIDTPTRQVAAFDFEPINGIISNKRIAFDLQKTNISGLPDGMTIDTDGNLWVALYGGGGVVNVNPHTGKVIRFVKLPVTKVTSCTFGGPLFNTLFVTTSSRDLTEKELAEEPFAGYVFAVKGLNVYGLAANSFKD